MSKKSTFNYWIIKFSFTIYSKGKTNLKQGRYVVSNCTMGLF